MGIFDIFNTKPVATNDQGAQSTQQQQTTAQPGNLPADAPAAPASSAGTANNGVVPANVPEAENSNSPLDQFKDLWEPVATEGEENSPPAALDPNKLSEVISKADFSKSINAENLAKISEGGEAAQAAFVESMNAVAQQVMMQATLASNKMIEQQVSQAIAAQEAKIPKLLKKQNLSESLSTTNPTFANPAVKPVIDAVQSQLAAKYPNASTAELTQMAQNFVSVMSESLSPKPEAEANPAEQGTDWEKFLAG